MGQVAYRLELPSTSRIHDVFNVSLLKQFHGHTSRLHFPLPYEIEASHPVMEPLQVLQLRLESRDGQPVKQVLVEWKVIGFEK